MSCGSRAQRQGEPKRLLRECLLFPPAPCIFTLNTIQCLHRNVETDEEAKPYKTLKYTWKCSRMDKIGFSRDGTHGAVWVLRTGLLGEEHRCRRTTETLRVC